MFSPDEVLRYADAFLKYNDEPVEFDPWQEIFLKDQSTLIILLKGRQEGFSFAVAAKKFIELQSPDVVNMTVQFVSYNLADAVDKIRYISIMAHSIPEKRRKKIAYETKTSIEFYDVGGKTTSRLISIACRPPRGKPGDVVLDEFGIYGNKAKMIYTAALPSITRGGNIIIGSTPLGTIGGFHDIYTNKKDYKNYVRYNVPWWQSKALCKNIDEARKKGVKEMETEDRVRIFGKKILKMEFTALDIQSFQQEYECTFIDSAESYISLDLIYKNTPGMRDGDRDKELDEGQGEIVDRYGDDGLEIKVFKTVDELILWYNPQKHGDLLYLGYDVARTRDAAVIFIVGLLPSGKKVSVAQIEMFSQTFEYQRDQIRAIMRSGLPIDRGCIDCTGIGSDTTETLQREFTETKLEAVTFNAESKDKLARGVKEGLEKQEFLLQNDNKFHRQIHSVKRISIAGGAFRYDSKRDEMGHADSFWAWALANYAIPKQDVKKGFYEQHREKRLAAETAKHSNTTAAPTGADEQPKRGKSASRLLREMGLR
jgi:phage FluMu gp28-like protein